MPSPFTRTHQANVSRDPERAGEMRVDREPVLASGTLPYRGTEQHGVPGEWNVDVDPDAADYGTTVAVPVEPEPDEETPVPVRVVGAGGPGELKAWRVIREYCRAGEPARRILGLDENRTSVKIRNTHNADTLYVGTDQFSDIGLGYPLPAGGELSLNAVTPVWAMAPGGADIPIAILAEVSQPR